MITFQAPYRRARKDDAMALAELVNMAGEGMPHHVWETLAAPGQSPWEVGQERAGRDFGSFSYRNAILREDDGSIAAGMVGYPIKAPAGPADYADMPPLFVPLQQLEDLVPGTWFIDILATYPAYRGKGIGQELLRCAETFARDSNCPAMSLIVLDSNSGARRLYLRTGFLDRSQRPVVKQGWKHSAANWVLMVKPL